ncbi:hypothetical protein [uncultured Prevotella sp.]|nr:hypothetical protein [uncultured Prevotella sp.]
MVVTPRGMMRTFSSTSAPTMNDFPVPRENTAYLFFAGSSM